jgi:hypothetical protein
MTLTAAFRFALQEASTLSKELMTGSIGGFATENLDVTTEIFGNTSQVPPLLDGSLKVHAAASRIFVRIFVFQGCATAATRPRNAVDVRELSCGSGRPACPFTC